jgi:hypothetical protein
MACTSVMLNGFSFHSVFSANIFNNIRTPQNAFLIIIFINNLILNGYNKSRNLWKDYYVEIKCQLDATDEFLMQILLLAQHFSGHLYAHHQEL